MPHTRNLFPAQPLRRNRGGTVVAKAMIMLTRSKSRLPLALSVQLLGVLFTNVAHAQPDVDQLMDPPGAIVRRPQRPAPTSPPPVAAPCALELSLRSQQSGRTVTISADVTNRQNTPITFNLSTGCTNGPVRFQGISPQHDFYGQCNRGACISDEPQPFALQPGERREVASVQIDLDGNTCNQPIRAGTHQVNAKLNFRSPPVSVCAPRPVSFVHPGAPRQPPNPITPVVAPRCPPMLPCGIYCPHGMKKSPQGCSQCACAESPLERLPLERRPLPTPPLPVVVTPAAAGLVGVYEGVHPHWRDRVILSNDGTYRRATGDAGHWTFDGKTLVLGWDSWGPEYLEVRGPGHFVARSNGFTLRRVH